MLKTLFVYCLILLTFTVSAQTDSTKQEESLLIADEMPEFTGGEAGMINFIKTNIQYPKAEKELGVQGIVYSTFIIEKDGSITDVKTTRGVPCGEGYDKEAKRIIESMPNWKPGKQNGKLVRVQIRLPIKFTLHNGGQKFECTEKALTEKKVIDRFVAGEKYFQNGAYENAIAEFSEALKLSPENAESLYYRGLAYLKLQKKTEACEDLNAAKKLEYQDAEKLVKKNCK
jgi:TonB family protein